MLKLLTSLLLCLATVTAAAQDHAGNRTVTTQIQAEADLAKGSELRPLAREVVALVGAKRFAEAQTKALALKARYEALFDAAKTQYVFASAQEQREHAPLATAPWERIDWGYRECLQMLAFLAAERRELDRSLEILGRVERLAPLSAGTLTEMGYVLNQQRKFQQALDTYGRARDIAERHASQRPFLGMSLRGMGYALVELGQPDAARRAYQQSLTADPGNSTALSELAYLDELKGRR